MTAALATPSTATAADASSALVRVPIAAADHALLLLLAAAEGTLAPRIATRLICVVALERETDLILAARGGSVPPGAYVEPHQASEPDHPSMPCSMDSHANARPRPRPTIAIPVVLPHPVVALIRATSNSLDTAAITEAIRDVLAAEVARIRAMRERCLDGVVLGQA